MWQELRTELHPKGIEIVTINIDDNKSNAQEFLRAHGLNQLTVVPDSDKSIVGRNDTRAAT